MSAAGLVKRVEKEGLSYATMHRLLSLKEKIRNTFDSLSSKKQRSPSNSVKEAPDLIGTTVHAAVAQPSTATNNTKAKRNNSIRRSLWKTKSDVTDLPQVQQSGDSVRSEASASSFYQVFEHATSPQKPPPASYLQHGSRSGSSSPHRTDVSELRSAYPGSGTGAGFPGMPGLKTTSRLTVRKAPHGSAVLNRQYLLIKHLGSGQYGNVKLVLNLVDRRLYAIKSVSKAHLARSIRCRSLGRRSRDSSQGSASKSEKTPQPDGRRRAASASRISFQAQSVIVEETSPVGSKKTSPTEHAPAELPKQPRQPSTVSPAFLEEQLAAATLLEPMGRPPPCPSEGWHFSADTTAMSAMLREWPKADAPQPVIVADAAPAPASKLMAASQHRSISLQGPPAHQPWYEDGLSELLLTRAAHASLPAALSASQIKFAFAKAAAEAATALSAADLPSNITVHTRPGQLLPPITSAVQSLPEPISRECFVHLTASTRAAASLNPAQLSQATARKLACAKTTARSTSPFATAHSPLSRGASTATASSSEPGTPGVPGTLTPSSPLTAVSDSVVASRLASQTSAAQAGRQNPISQAEAAVPNLATTSYASLVGSAQPWWPAGRSSGNARQPKLFPAAQLPPTGKSTAQHQHSLHSRGIIAEARRPPLSFLARSSSEPYPAAAASVAHFGTHAPRLALRHAASTPVVSAFAAAASSSLPTSTPDASCIASPSYSCNISRTISSTAGSGEEAPPGGLFTHTSMVSQFGNSSSSGRTTDAGGSSGAVQSWEAILPFVAEGGGQSATGLGASACEGPSGGSSASLFGGREPMGTFVSRFGSWTSMERPSSPEPRPSSPEQRVLSSSNSIVVSEFGCGSPNTLSRAGSAAVEQLETAPPSPQPPAAKLAAAAAAGGKTIRTVSEFTEDAMDTALQLRPTGAIAALDLAAGDRLSSQPMDESNSSKAATHGARLTSLPGGLATFLASRAATSFQAKNAANSNARSSSVPVQTLGTAQINAGGGSSSQLAAAGAGSAAGPQRKAMSWVAGSASRSSSVAGVEVRRGSVRSPTKARAMKQEIDAMKNLDHPNVVRLHEVIDDPGTDSLLLVMENVDGGSLEQQLDFQTGRWRTLPEATVRKHVREICKGLEYLHSNNVVHGDLKPANLLCSSDGRVKIGDFGSALIYQEQEGLWDGEVNGTPAFRAPETLQPNCILTRKVDVWALGVCMCTWITGELPFSGGSAMEVFTAIRTQPCRLPAPADCSPELQDLLAKIMVKDPEERLPLEEVMQHPWLIAAAAPPRLAVPHDAAPNATGSSLKAATPADVSPGCSAIAASLLPIFKEVRFGAGEEIYGQATASKSVFLIADGEVEVMMEAGSSPVQAASQPTALSMRTKSMKLPKITSGADDDFAAEGSGLGMPAMTVKSMNDMMHETPRPVDMGNGHILLATRGPGDFIGLSGLSGSPEERSYSGSPTKLRARTAVTAFQAEKAQMEGAIQEWPELGDVLRARGWQQRSDTVVAEALSLLHLGSQELQLQHTLSAAASPTNSAAARHAD